MAVRRDGAFFGTIGGGELEWRLLAEARAALDAGRGPARFLSQALGPDLGQCCGGRVTLLVETFDARDSQELAALATAEAQGIAEVECHLVDGRVRRTVAAASTRLRGEGSAFGRTSGAQRSGGEGAVPEGRRTARQALSPLRGRVGEGGMSADRIEPARSFAFPVGADPPPCPPPQGGRGAKCPMTGWLPPLARTGEGTPSGAEPSPIR